ncbi:MAG: hypothetical protein WA786_07080 [Acidimicrobiales bacterium]
MAAFNVRPNGALRRLGAVLVVALVLAGCGSPGTTIKMPSSQSEAIASSYVPPTSICPSSQDFLKQSLNGDITGCFRVPDLHSSSLLVSMFAYLDDGFKSAPTTTTMPSSPSGDLTLTLGTRHATPGERVKVTGHYVGQPPSPRQTYVNICWDGCQNGLQEDGVPALWISHKTFTTTLQVPETAWLEVSHGVVSAHPLVSGNYQVAVQCLGNISGCALGSGDADTTIALMAPSPSRCVSSTKCETLRLSAATAQVGDIIRVSGWAPLQTIIGQPFSYELSITKAPQRSDFPALSYWQNPKGGGLDVVLTPRVLRVTPSRSWASLGRVTYVSSSFAGPSPVTPSASSGLIAWCRPSGLVVTGGSSPVQVATHGVAAALVGTPLTLFSSPASNPQCTTVLMDPHHRDSIFAGFDAAVDDSAPPIYIAGLYTTDGGATWRRVPVPAGFSIEDFGGFRGAGASVFALFAGADSYQDQRFPPGTVAGRVAAEVTSDGGATWSTSTLGCPPSGPCATFGPYQWGNCAMNGADQPLLVGPAHSTGGAGVRWTDSTWITNLNSCFSQQLVATSAHGLVLLDPSSQYPLLQSNDSGRTWTYRLLPSIKGFDYGADSVPQSNYLLMAPDGSLFATLTIPAGTRQELFRLQPGATSWCQVPNALHWVAGATVTSMRVTPTDLVWSQSVYPSSGNPASSMHVVALARLHC